MSKDEKTALTIAANDLVHELAHRADVILITPHTLSQSRSHSYSKPYVAAHDEAGKIRERETLGIFT